MIKQKDLKALQIRWAKEYDIRDLVILEIECFATHYYREHRFNDTDFDDYLQKKDAIFLVAILSSSLIGYVAGLIRNSQSQLAAWLDSIAVSPSAREKGIGSQLLQCFIEEANQRACKRVLLQVATDNESGMVFFSRRGFREIRYLPRYYGNRWDGVLMELKI